MGHGEYHKFGISILTRKRGRRMAHIQRLNMERELVLLAHGKKTHTLPEVIADWALEFVRADLPAPAHHDELQWLEKLYRLEDPRP